MTKNGLLGRARLADATKFRHTRKKSLGIFLLQVSCGAPIVIKDPEEMMGEEKSSERRSKKHTGKSQVSRKHTETEAGPAQPLMSKRIQNTFSKLAKNYA